MDQNSFTEFYSRQIGCLGAVAQSRLQKKKAALVGLGGLGSHILQTLALYGLKEIRLIDGDGVALHNLHRQPLYDLSDQGKTKADCALKWCEARNPHTTFKAYANFINHNNAEQTLKDVDVIIDGTDSHETSVILNHYSCENEIPLVAASVEGRKGYVGVFYGGKERQPCHACLFPDFPENVPTCSEVGVDPLAVSLTASLQANMVIQTLLEENTFGIVLNIDSSGTRITSLRAEKDMCCSVCKNYQGHIKDNIEMSFKIVSELSGRPLVDVRNEDEFAKAPREAINIPLPRLVSDPALIPQEDIVLCCVAGVRSEQAACFLKEVGFEYDIQVLDQGQPR